MDRSRGGSDAEPASPCTGKKAFLSSEGNWPSIGESEACWRLIAGGVLFDSTFPVSSEGRANVSLMGFSLLISAVFDIRRSSREPEGLAGIGTNLSARS